MSIVVPELDPITERQYNYLVSLGVMPPDGCTKRQASVLIDQTLERRQQFRAGMQARGIDSSSASWVRDGGTSSTQWVNVRGNRLSQPRPESRPAPIFILQDEEIAEYETDGDDYDGWGQKW